MKRAIVWLAVFYSLSARAGEFTKKETSKYCDAKSFVARDCYLKFTPVNPRVPVTIQISVETDKERVISFTVGNSLSSDEFNNCATANIFEEKWPVASDGTQSTLRCTLNFVPADAENIERKSPKKIKNAASGKRNLMSDDPDYDETKPSCRDQVLEVVNRVIDGYRSELGQCIKAEDCMYSAGGSGVHVNRRHYHDLLECFTYADGRADRICRSGYNPDPDVDGAGGLAYAWLPGKMPESYSCVKNRCVGYWPKRELYKSYNEEFKWLKVIPLGGPNPKKIEECKKKIEMGFAKKFKKVDR